MTETNGARARASNLLVIGQAPTSGATAVEDVLVAYQVCDLSIICSGTFINQKKKKGSCTMCNITYQYSLEELGGR